MSKTLRLYKHTVGNFGYWSKYPGDVACDKCRGPGSWDMERKDLCDWCCGTGLLVIPLGEFDNHGQ
jgi:hypothetical protein